MKLSLLLTFIGTQLILGRKAAIPLGIAGGMSFTSVVMLSFGLDLLFVPLIYFIYGAAASRIKFISRIKRLLIIKQGRGEHSQVFKWFKRLGKTGVALAPAIPFSGGVNLSIPLAHMLNLKPRDGFLLISLGNFLGCILIALATEGIIAMFV
ncbi:MAG: hypothetical protein B5M48_04365 [Candidatus Omnitrophica bacterium 4484_213]|nr:MAG: hypothetical protein B5M48_04365 [Candidatus Omnitrophica bacterium 4484_213]